MSIVRLMAYTFADLLTSKHCSYVPRPLFVRGQCFILLWENSSQWQKGFCQVDDFKVRFMVRFMVWEWLRVSHDTADSAFNVRLFNI